MKCRLDVLRNVRERSAIRMRITCKHLEITTGSNGVHIDMSVGRHEPRLNKRKL